MGKFLSAQKQDAPRGDRVVRPDRDDAGQECRAASGVWDQFRARREPRLLDEEVGVVEIAGGRAPGRRDGVAGGESQGRATRMRSFGFVDIPTILLEAAGAAR
jgi:hypothetical protein